MCKNGVFKEAQQKLFDEKNLLQENYHCFGRSLPQILLEIVSKADFSIKAKYNSKIWERMFL